MLPSRTGSRNLHPCHPAPLPPCAPPFPSPPPRPAHPSRAPSYFTRENFWLSYFQLWALTLNGEATYPAPGAYDGYTLLATSVVAGPHSVASIGAFGASAGERGRASVWACKGIVVPVGCTCVVYVRSYRECA
jgi:hypothetical protein